MQTKKLLLLLFVAFTASTSYAQNYEEAASRLKGNGQTGLFGDQGDGTFRNPVIAADYSDPDPLRVVDDFYLVSSTFESYPGVTILHSKDLVNWETIGAAYTHLADVSDDYTWKRMNRYNGGVYAPTISYHDGKFYIFANLYTDGLYMASAERPEGPWTEQMIKDKYGRPLKVARWSDPCPLWDDDGKAYLVASHPCRDYWFSYMFQMTPDGTQLLDADSAYMADLTAYRIHDDPKTFNPWPRCGTVISPYFSSEGNRIFKHDGYYYLQHIEFTNKGNGEGTYIFRSRNLYGTLADGTAGSPGKPGEYEHFCVERVYTRDTMRIPGQGGYVTTPDGRWWWMGQFTCDNAEGRDPWLVPVTWIDGWPIIGDSISDMQGHTPIQMKKPIQLKSQTSNLKPQSPMLPQGSDKFSSSELNPRWQWNHVPREGAWSLTDRKGWLRLKAFKPQGKRKDFFGASGTIFQHYMHGDSVVVTIRMDISHIAEGGRAGLAIFNGGKSYANFGVSDGHYFYEENGEAQTSNLKSQSSKVVYLRTSIGFDAKAHFSYSTDNKHYYSFGSAYQLVPGNFRGAMIGIFNYNDHQDAGYVDIDWFKYEIKNTKIPLAIIK